MAIDRERLAALYGFAGRPGVRPRGGSAHYVSGANAACLTQDIAGANRLLDEQGVLDSDGDGVREYDGLPLRITFMTSTNALRQAPGARARLVAGDRDRDAIDRPQRGRVLRQRTGGGVVPAVLRGRADVRDGRWPEPQSYLSDNRCTHIPRATTTGRRGTSRGPATRSLTPPSRSFPAPAGTGAGGGRAAASTTSSCRATSRFHS